MRYPYLDLKPVGIWGHSGSGYAAAAAMFRYPDFYKVAHLQVGQPPTTAATVLAGERHIGQLTPQADGTSDYVSQTNILMVKTLKGRLLLAHGLIKNNVPPYNTMLVVVALTKANKTFDLDVFPQALHAYGTNAPYMTHYRWHYFVRHLASMETPDYEMISKTDPRDGVL